MSPMGLMTIGTKDRVSRSGFEGDLCYTLFVVAVGSYVLLWLAARRRDGA